MSRRPRRLATLLLGVALGLGGCRGGARRGDRGAADAEAMAAVPDRPWAEASPAVRARVDAAMAALAADDGRAFLDAARTLVASGEAAMPPLLERLAAGTPRERSRAAYVLGFLGDRRAIEPLVRAVGDEDPDVRCDAGAALLELGDDRGFGPLVDALAGRDGRRRVRAADALAEATGGQRLGFEPDGPPEERDAAVLRWRAWLERREAERREGLGGPAAAPEAGPDAGPDAVPDAPPAPGPRAPGAPAPRR